MALVVPKLVSDGNFKLENFGAAELGQARAAVREVKDLCVLIQRAMSPATLDKTKSVVQNALRDFFDVENDVGYLRLKFNLNRLNTAITTGNVTLVYRPDIVVKNADGTPAMLDEHTPFTGGNVYGYTRWQLAGSGYRVVCGKVFITDPTPYYASTTIYHEMSHKVLNTKDHAYGEANCKTCAEQGNGPSNADSYAYFAIALGKARASI